MKNDQVAIIGFGYVGKAYDKIFKNALIYDPYLKVPVGEDTISCSQEQINDECELAIVCVPTPMLEEPDQEFKDVDLSIIEDVLGWIKTPYILLKSTVPPGTVDYLERKYKKNIAFSPEYVGEGKYQITPWKYMAPNDPSTHEFQIFGGRPGVIERIAEIFTKKLGPEKVYYLCTAKEAEMIKYMENSWGALKVIWANQFYQLCKKLGVSYIRCREGWALDNRVERMHTSVFVNNQGFGGKCYPKDLNGIVAAGDKVGIDLSLIKEVLRYNNKIKKNENEISK